MKKSLYILSLSFIFLNAEFIRDDSKNLVTDRLNKLIWEDSNVTLELDWENAIKACNKLTFSGYSDWRLPNINELTSIFDRSKKGLTINDSFKHTKETVLFSSYWSSTSVYDDTTVAWVSAFYGGERLMFEKAARLSVRCVRDQK